MEAWQVAILVALIGQLPVLVTLFRVNQVHQTVQRANNGLHDELVYAQKDMIRRMEALEAEVGTIYRAVGADAFEKGRKPPRWMRLRR